MTFSFYKKNKIYFKPYYGYGDWLSLNGMVRFLSSKYDEVIIITESSDITFVKNLYKDDSKVKVIYWYEYQESDSSYDYLDLQIWNQSENNRKNYYNRYNQIGNKFGFDVLTIFDECYERLESPHNFHNECKKLLEDNASSFYVAAGIPKEYKLDKFYYERDYESENQFFESLNLPEEYVVICDYGDNLIDRKYIQDKDAHIININNISEKYFDIIKVIENAKEVHLIENSIALFVYHLQYKKLMNDVQINMHTYARIEDCRRCTSSKKSNVYLDMLLNPSLDNWNFIYLE